METISTTKAKAYIAALLHNVKMFNDERVYGRGVSYPIAEIEAFLAVEEPSIHCPHCKSENIYTYDNESLGNVHEENQVAEAFLDNEIYASAKCKNCKSAFDIVGDITWRQPKN